MKLYLVVPCYNEEAVILDSARILKAYVEKLILREIVDEGSKIVFVNDGSVDQTETILTMLHQQDPVYSVISFSRNYGHQYAVMAGYMFARNKCDICISIDADLQQDINAIELFIDSYTKGNEIVYGVRNTRDTDGFFKKLTSQLFYKLMQTFGCNIIPNHADYRLLSNRVLNVLSEYQENSIFLRGMIPSLGFNSSIVYFDVKDRTAGESKYTVKKMMTLAENGILGYSELPIRLIAFAGAILLMTSTSGLIVYVIASLVFQSSSQAVLILLMLALFTGVILISNGIVGAYVAKCYQESKHRPRYLIEKTLHVESR